MIAFIVISAVMLAAAVMTVVSRNPVVSAMWLGLTLAGTAGMFVLLDAEFLAAIQLIVYAGAILVFVLFVVMLLNLGRVPGADPKVLQRWLGLWLAASVAGLLALVIYRTELGPGTGSPSGAFGNVEAVSVLMLSKYIMAFELTSVLLTAAVVGAVVLAKRRRVEQP